MDEAVYYRLTLAPEAEPFRAEIEYALGYVEAAYPLVRCAQAERELRYGGEGADIPLRLFDGPLTVREDGLHLDRAAFLKMSDFAPRPTSGDRPGYDAIGLIFFMLSRVEERDAALPRDRHDRFDPAYDWAVCEGVHARPIVDEAAAAIVRSIAGRPLPCSGGFELCPTHDVDTLKRYHRWWEPLRYAAGDLVKRGRPASAARRLLAYRPGEPEASFRDMMTLSERFGLTSRFFFLGESNDPMDSPYVLLFPKLLRRMSDEIQSRGHRIGFHPGYRTLGDEAEFERQRRSLESVVGAPVREGRQHVLRYRADDTPALWSRMDMTDDFTLAHPDRCGFRNGACRPYYAYDLRMRRPLPLRQTATAVMDFALFDPRYRALSVEQALEETTPILEAARRYGGRLVLLHHTGNPNNAARRFYERFLERAV